MHALHWGGSGGNCAAMYKLALGVPLHPGFVLQQDIGLPDMNMAQWAHYPVTRPAPRLPPDMWRHEWNGMAATMRPSMPPFAAAPMIASVAGDLGAEHNGVAQVVQKNARCDGVDAADQNCNGPTHLCHSTGLSDLPSPARCASTQAQQQERTRPEASEKDKRDQVKRHLHGARARKIRRFLNFAMSRGRGAEFSRVDVRTMCAEADMAYVMSNMTRVTDPARPGTRFGKAFPVLVPTSSGNWCVHGAYFDFC